MPFEARAAALSLPSPYRELNWQNIDATPVRSQEGRQGVRFLDVGNVDVVVKLGRNMRREWIATQLASMAGLQVPQQMVVAPAPAPGLVALCRRSDSPAERGIVRPQMLLMRHVAGQSFAELLGVTQKSLREVDADGQKILSRMGQICAFDGLIGNTDRFPVIAPNVNSGNVMVRGTEVIAIDNTLTQSMGLEDEGYLALYNVRLDRMLAAATAPSSAAMHACVANVELFFPSDLRPHWAAMRSHFIAGIGQGILQVAAMDIRAVQNLLRPAKEDLPEGLESFVLNNLRRFRAAAATPAAPVR